MISAPVQPSPRAIRPTEAPPPAPVAETASPFPEEVREALHASDRHAAAAVIGVMLGIFAVGLILYTVILFSVL